VADGETSVRRPRHTCPDALLFARYSLAPKDDRSAFRIRRPRVFGRRQAELNRAPRVFEDGRVVEKG